MMHNLPKFSRPMLIDTVKLLKVRDEAILSE